MKIGELWALPSLLRFVLIENLRRLAVRVEARPRDAPDRQRRGRPGAGDATTAPTAQAILSRYSAHARDTTFATQLLYRLRDGSQNAGKALDLARRASSKSPAPTPRRSSSAEHQTLSSGNVTTGNIIRGLRLINDVDWTVWFEGVSRIDALLRERSDFAALDFLSRDQYRTAIEDLARRSNLSRIRRRRKGDRTGRPCRRRARRRRACRRRRRSGSAAYRCRLLPRRPAPAGTGKGDRLSADDQPGSSSGPSASTGWLGIVVPVFVLTVLLLVLAGDALGQSRPVGRRRSR